MTFLWDGEYLGNLTPSVTLSLKPLAWHRWHDKINDALYSVNI